ncbi:MAG: alkaline phosphatase PhoX, partial [Betaproteobacteria bacterium]
MSKPSLDQLIALRISRRDVLKLGGATGLASLLGLSQSACSTLPKGNSGSATLGFKGVPISDADTVVVPEGYTSQVFFAWGDPISDGPAFAPDASNSAAEQAVQAGMHHDGMNFFPLPLGAENSDHGLLVLNHEYLDQRLLYPDAMKTWT